MNVASTLDERYFDWLYKQVADSDIRDPSESRGLLCERLYKTPFEWDIRNDENRAQDGIRLREEFLDELGESYDDHWLSLDCSIFEMLIALARRASFQTGSAPDYWFWVMLTNLEISKYHDESYHSAIDDAVSRVLDRMIRRTYEPNGRGGLFPLRDPERDQREVELWYQLSAYLLENFDF